MTEQLVVLATALPWVVVWVVAAVVAALRWTKHPVVSALVVTASVIHVLVTVAGRLLPFVMRDRGLSGAGIGLYSTAVGLVGLVGSVCIVAAAFVGREGAAPPSITRPP